MITFMGDTHGQYDLLPEDRNVIVLGDVGIFTMKDVYAVNKFPRVKFIRGNHDNPHLMQYCKGYLGDYGYKDGIFFISGAHSKDWASRTPGEDWWPEEQLNAAQYAACYDLWNDARPDFVISHEAPWPIVELTEGRPIYASATSTFLQTLWHKWQPRLWLYGHHHKSFKVKSNGTLFRCLAQGEQFQI